VLEPGTATHGRIVPPAVAPRFGALCARQSAAVNVAQPTPNGVGDLVIVGGIVLGLGAAGFFVARRRRVAA
jgi:hypothetical protein